MAELLLFHHALGLTPGVVSFADSLRSEGHVVHTPDLYDGRTFTDLDEGVAYGESVGTDSVIEQARRAADALPVEIVYGGFSFGVVAAQLLAQTRTGARGALFFHDCIAPEAFGTPWPAGVPLQVHTMERDKWVDLDTAHALTSSIEGGELFLYPGDGHLFADEGSPDYEAGAAALLRGRVLAFLGSL